MTATVTPPPSIDPSDPNWHTPHEYHVKRSLVPDKWWVMNPLDLIHCVHKTEEDAHRCALGTCLR